MDDFVTSLQEDQAIVFLSAVLSWVHGIWYCLDYRVLGVPTEACPCGGLGRETVSAHRYSDHRTEFEHA